jgi:hypothetical protein
MRNDSRMRRAALAYARHCDLPVLPCRSGGKEPITEHGCKDATKDPAKIYAWWLRWPDANVGIATGVVSGVAVLDVDPHKGGDQSFATLVAQYGELPVTPTVATGGDGQHYYFRPAADAQIHNSASTLGPGLDVRADGGYVIAPPSVHPSGQRYRWAARHGSPRLRWLHCPSG